MTEADLIEAIKEEREKINRHILSMPELLAEVRKAECSASDY